MNNRSTGPLKTGTSVPSPVNLGPLTTAFAQPSSCADTYVSFERNQGFWVLVRDQTCTDIGPIPNTACFPSSIATGTQFSDVNFYSPGVACPIGYAPALSSKSAGKTLNWCCPSNFKHTNGACFSTPMSEQTAIIVHQCNQFDFGLPNAISFSIWLDVSSFSRYISFGPSQQSLTISKSIAPTIYATVTAQHVVIALDETGVFKTFSQSSSASSSASPFNSRPSGGSKSPHLSAGAITGICVTLFVFFWFVAATFMLLRRRKRQTDIIMGRGGDIGKIRRKMMTGIPRDDGETAKFTDGDLIISENAPYRENRVDPRLEHESSRSTQALEGNIDRDAEGNGSSRKKLQKMPTNIEMNQWVQETSNLSAEQEPHSVLPTVLSRSYTPPDPDEITTLPYNYVNTRATERDETETVSDGDTQMGTPKTGEISETASIVIGNLPKPDAAPRDDQIADLEHRLSELRRLKALEEEQAKQETGR